MTAAAIIRSVGPPTSVVMNSVLLCFSAVRRHSFQVVILNISGSTVNSSSQPSTNLPVRSICDTVLDCTASSATSPVHRLSSSRSDRAATPVECLVVYINKVESAEGKAPCIRRFPRAASWRQRSSSSGSSPHSPQAVSRKQVLSSINYVCFISKQPS